MSDGKKCGTFARMPSDPDDQTARLSKEFELAVRSSIKRGRAAPSVRVLYGEVSALRRDLVRVTTVEDRNARNVLTCVYCGQAYPPGSPTHGSAVLTEHIAACEKHPMHALRLLAVQLAEALDTADSEEPFSRHAPHRGSLLQAARKAGLIK